MKIALSETSWFSLSNKALLYLVKKNSDTISYNFVPEFYGCSQWWREGDDRWQDCWRRDREKLIFIEGDYQTLDREGYLYKNDSLVFYFKDLYDKWIRIHPDIIEVIEKLKEESFSEGCKVSIKEVDFNPWDDWCIEIENGKENVKIKTRALLYESKKI